MNAELPRLSPDAGPCILVAAEELPRFAEIPLQGVAVFGVESVGDEVLGLIDTLGRDLEMVTAPMLCLGFAAIHPSAIATLEAARRRLEAWSASDFPAPMLVDAHRLSSGLPLLLSSALTERVQSYAAHVTRLSRELFRLRAAHEDTLNAFATVENFISASGIQPCNLMFENLPDGAALLSPAAAPVTQLLPVSTLGLSIIQLHVGDWTTVERPFGGMHVELRTREDHETHGAWSVPLDEMPPGWVTLSLSGGLTGLQRTPELVIRPLGGLGVLPPLSLGPLQPIPAFRPRTSEPGGPAREIDRRSLALRTWCGIPGVRPPAVGTAVDLRRPEDDGGVRDIAVPFTLLRGAEHVMRTWQPEFDPVGYLPELRGLLCHPPAFGTTWAQMRDFPAGGQPFRLSVKAVVRSPQARPIEFAFAFSTRSPEQACGEIDAARGPIVREDLVFGGWRQVTYDDPAVLWVLLNAPDVAAGSLFFGTRMARGTNNDFAWASFYNLRKTVLGQDAAADMAQAIPMSQDAIKAGAPDPVMVLDGVPLSLSVLEGVVDTQPAWLSSMPTVLYDHDRRGIFCHPPPPSGIALAQLPGLTARDPFSLLARLHVANSGAEPVDFAMIVSTLGADAVLARLNGSPETGAGDDFAWSGWTTVSYDNDVLADVGTLPPGAEDPAIFLATRMSAAARSNDYAWAYFMDIRTLGHARPDARARVASAP